MALERFELPRYRTDITLFYLYHYLSDEDRPTKAVPFVLNVKKKFRDYFTHTFQLEVSSFESPYVYTYLYQRPFLLLFLWLLLALLVHISSELQYYLLSLTIRRLHNCLVSWDIPNLNILFIISPLLDIEPITVKRQI